MRDLVGSDQSILAPLLHLVGDPRFLATEIKVDNPGACLAFRDQLLNDFSNMYNPVIISRMRMLLDGYLGMPSVKIDDNQSCASQSKYTTHRLDNGNEGSTTAASSPSQVILAPAKGLKPYQYLLDFTAQLWQNCAKASPLFHFIAALSAFVLLLMVYTLYVRSPRVSRESSFKAFWSPVLKESCQKNQRLSAHLEAVSQKHQASPLGFPVDPSNFSRRFTEDINGVHLDPRPRIIVIHTTQLDVKSILGVMRLPHETKEGQLSYHVIIDRSARIITLLDPSLAAITPGISSFNGESVRGNDSKNFSVDNFALHVLVIEKPFTERMDPSIISEQQYDTLTVLIWRWMRLYNIPFSSIVDFDGISRNRVGIDSDRVDWNRLQPRLASLGLLCTWEP